MPRLVPDAGSRAGRQDKRIMEVEWRQESLGIAQKIHAYTEARAWASSSSRLPGC
jgi:hypothetical protein